MVSKKNCIAQKLRTLVRTCVVLPAIGFTFSGSYIACTLLCHSNVSEKNALLPYAGLMSKSMYMMCIVFFAIYLGLISEINKALGDCVPEGSAGLGAFSRILLIVMGIVLGLYFVPQFIWLLSREKKVRDIERQIKQEAFREKLMKANNH